MKGMMVIGLKKKWVAMTRKKKDGFEISFDIIDMEQLIIEG